MGAVKDAVIPKIQTPYFQSTMVVGNFGDYYRCLRWGRPDGYLCASGSCRHHCPGPGGDHCPSSPGGDHGGGTSGNRGSGAYSLGYHSRPRYTAAGGGHADADPDSHYCPHCCTGF